MWPAYDLSEIEIEHNCYCEENGYFCPFLHKASGICFATSCQRMMDILEENEIDRLNTYAEEMAEGKIWLEGDKVHKDLEISENLYSQAIAQLENYGATTIDLDIGEDDLDDLRRSG